MSTTAACRCVRCDQAQCVTLRPGVDFTRYLLAYACEACGERQVRLDTPSERRNITHDDIPAVTT